MKLTAEEKAIMNTALVTQFTEGKLTAEEFAGLSKDIANAE